MTQRTLLSVRCVTVLLVIALTCGVSSAQVLYGSLTGNVADPSNAAVPGAKVEALNVGTGVTRQATTDERGAYLFNNLQFGVYKITVTAAAFRTVIENNMQVNENAVRRVDVRLLPRYGPRCDAARLPGRRPSRRRGRSESGGARGEPVRPRHAVPRRRPPRRTARPTRCAPSRGTRR
jgi:hypothetical protein